MTKGLEIVPIKDKTKLEVRQSPTPHLPRISGEFLRKKYDDCQHDPKQADV